MLINRAHHPAGLEVLEAGLAQVVEGLAFVVGVCRENASGRGGTLVLGIAFFYGVQIVKPLNEHEESQLFDHTESGLEASPDQNAFQI
ncbi:hypothetical protein TM1040_3125 (plasmid) [Ruegeria sp. TM1040]|nr:hypothetical protein TM1040_3125 [Ruegeria sp. TM1040]